MMVALYRDIITNEPCGLHRTALTLDGNKIGRGYLGRKRGAAIKLSPDDEVYFGLTVGEGIETTLSAIAFGLRPAWSPGDAGGIANFPVLSGVDALTIIVDHDANGAGQKAAAECRIRWLQAGREVIEVSPDRRGEDLNDVLRASA